MKQKQLTIQITTMGLLLLCVFANPLERISPILKWIDELICLGICLGAAVLWLQKKELRRQILKQLLYFIPFFIFMFMQLLGSLIFRYQPWGAVIIDALTNAKFWLTLYGCYLLGRVIPGGDVDDTLLKGAKVVSVLLLVMFIMERFGIIFSGFQTYFDKYKCAILMYTHPTYLVAALCFLLAVLLSYWERKLWPYVLADLIMMIFTFRSKAYGGVLMFLAAAVIVVLLGKKIRIWNLALMGASAVILAWDKIIFYFVSYGEESPRVAFLVTGLEIMWDYFPLGTGFATFASNQAAVHYSPVYYLYGLDNHIFLGVDTQLFMSDSFWPIVFAQSGAIGMVAFLAILLLLCINVWKMYDINRRYYAAAIFCIAYMMIASVAESAFCNPAAVPLALLIGYWLGQTDQKKEMVALDHKDVNGEEHPFDGK